MTKYVLGANGYALFITDKPLEGFDVYREVTNEQAKKLASTKMERIHFSHLDELLK